MKPAIMGYRWTENIGDAFQSYALARLLNPDICVYRDQLKNYEGKAVINGFLREELPVNNDILYAGIYIGHNHKPKYEALKGHKIGARDPYSNLLFKEQGLNSEMIGCATLTLARYDGPRSGIIQGDVQTIPNAMKWEDQWILTEKRLEQFRTAELVRTKRLHVAMPCLAMGTPVIIPWSVFPKLWQPERLTILDELGFEYDKVMTLDVRWAAERYKNFLHKNSIQFDPVEKPICPLPSQ